MSEKKVVIFGAAGITGKYITRKMQAEKEFEVTAFVRNPAKFDGMDVSDIHIIQGDALNADDVEKAMEGQEILLCSLEGDVLTMAKNIVSALPKTTVKRIIWITGMGIHGEIKGINGIFLRMLAKSRPEYIEAADTILNCSVSSTLLRCGGICDGDNENYHLTREGEKPRGSRGMAVDRAAIAQCMADMIKDETLGINESLGVTNA